MGIDLSGFVTKPDEQDWLWRLSDTLQRNRVLDERKSEREQRDQERQDAKRASMSNFLMQYADPKEHLSGSPTDPQVTKGFMDIMQQGAVLINQNKGLTTDMLMTALAPKVNQLAQYGSKAKVISQQIKDRLSGIPENSGYDKFKLQQAARQSAFFNQDGSMKDVSTVSPEIDYVAQTVKDNPYEVTNNKGLDEWLKGQSKMVNSLDVTHINARGGKDRKKVKATSYPFAIPETDEQGVNNRTFVPQYEHATDAGEKIYHEFEDGKGGKVKAPVRLLDKDVYQQVLGNSPGTADWVRGQVMKAIESGEYKDSNGKNIDINSPQANHIAQAILYDELKSRGMGSMEDVEVQKANPAPRISVNIKNASDVPVIDIYKSINEKADEHKDNFIKSRNDGKKIFGVVQVNTLDDDEQSVILEKAKKAGGNDITVGDIYIRKYPDGIWIVGAANDTPLTKLTPVGSNLQANQSLGVKSKQKSVLQNQGKQSSNKWDKYKSK